jgi:hypothetical protein
MPKIFVPTFTICFVQAASTVEWHSKGDYFTTVVPTDILLIKHILFALFSFWVMQEHNNKMI